MSLSIIPLRRIENIFSPQIVCHYAQTDDALNERLKYWIEAIYTTWNGLVRATVRLHICMQYYNVHSAFPIGGKKLRKKPSHYPILPTDVIGWFSQTELRYSLPKPFCVLLHKPSILEASMLYVCMQPSQHRQVKTQCLEGKLKYWINKTSTILYEWLDCSIQCKVVQILLRASTIGPLNICGNVIHMVLQTIMPPQWTPIKVSHCFLAEVLACGLFTNSIYVLLTGISGTLPNSFIHLLTMWTGICRYFSL